MNIACLITKSKSDELFRSSSSLLNQQQSQPQPQQQRQEQQQQLQLQYHSHSFNHQPHSIKFTIQRDFVIKIPRMVSKKKDIHRPFVVMNVKPMLQPPRNDTCIGSNDGPSFCKDEEDIWISLKSTIKGS